MKIASLRVRILATILGAAAAAASAQSPNYRITLLGDLDPKGINAAGQLVGTRGGDVDPVGRDIFHATRWIPGVSQETIASSGPGWGFGYGFSRGDAINDAGDVVGYCFGCPSAFRWTASGAVQYLQAPLGSSFSSGYRINNAGQVLGTVIRDTDSSATPIVWDAAGTPQPFTLGTPTAINDRGQIVGSTDDGKAFVWTPGEGMTTFSGGGASATAWDINNRGQVVGSYSAPNGASNGFVWSADGGFQPLAGSFAGSRPVAINETGTVIGLGGPNHQFVFVWNAETGVKDLNALIDPVGPTGVVITNVIDLNDAGQILAKAGNTNLLLSPVPEPGTLVLFALGLLVGRLAVGRRSTAC